MPAYPADETLPTLRPRRGAPRAAPRIGDIAGATDTGRVREHNEDQFLIADLDRWVHIRQSSVTSPEQEWVGHGQGVILLVADGMGGHGHGDVASSVSVDTLVHEILTQASWLAATRDAVPGVMGELRDAILQCQARIAGVAGRKGADHERMGTTLTMAYVCWPDAFVAHAGDSRCYLLRQGALVRETTDHTLAAKLREQGVSPNSEAGFSHVLVNAVGAGTAELEPELRHVSLQLGDTLLLCSDGLTGELDEATIQSILSGAGSSTEACQQLIRAANEAGGHDNITAVVARF